MRIITFSGLRFIVLAMMVFGGVFCPMHVSAVDANDTPQASPGSTDPDREDEPFGQLVFREASLDLILEEYSKITERTLLLAPGLPTPTFTLRSQGKLSKEDYLKALETVLTMHGVGLVEYGDRFMRVVPIATIRQEALNIFESLPEGVVLEPSGMMVSQMVALRHIDIQEATAAIEPLRNKNGQLHAFERTNTIMITDYASNINRMLQVLRMLDHPIEAREEPNIIQIRFARAADIKQRLEQIIAESQRDQQQASAPRQRTTGRPGAERSSAPRDPAGVIRATTVRPREGEGETASVAEEILIAEAQRGIIRGRVQIIADDRTNLLIIITRPENMAFFERIVAVLDVETTPDVIVEVVRLEFANAEEIEGMLNNLIGASSREDRPIATDTGDSEGAQSRRLAEIEAALRRRERDAEATRRSSVGELSKDNITILSDKRTNSLILMARRGDIETIKDIVRDMDRMLAQVLIEAVILEVTLDDSIETGVSWVQEALTAYTRNSRGERSPLMSFAGGGGGATSITPQDASAMQDSAALSRSGLGYFFTLFDLNVNAVLRASATDSRSRVVSTPALLTTDNTEATLSSTERIYVFEGTTFVGTATDSRTARYRQEDVGLTLTVRPQINENHVVMMEITQEISEPGDITNPDTDNLAGQRISINRKIQASIAVRSGQTIVLGGQVRERDSRTRTKVPVLGDIPIVGRLFNSDARGSGRSETIVFITPYVLDSPEKVAEETERRRDSLDIGGMWQRGWSGSELAEPPGYERPLPDFRRDRSEGPQRRAWASGQGQQARVRSSEPDDEVSAFIAEQRRKLHEAMREE